MNHKGLSEIKLQYLRPFLCGVLHKETRRIVFRLICTVLIKFFYLQFQTKWKLKKRLVVSVDHELDKSIPFSPEYGELYISFIKIWMTSAWYLYKRYGKAGLKEMAIFVDEIEKMYTLAGNVYSDIQSTTNRPKEKKGIVSYLIHALDPHLHCVPSLHVWVVCYCYIGMKRAFANLSVQEEHSDDLEFLYRKAVAITESILCLKQHSLNCVYSSLYGFTKLFSDFTLEHAKAFIQTLFTELTTDIENTQEIQAFLLKGLADFSLYDTGTTDLSIMYKNFLMEFPVKYAI